MDLDQLVQYIEQSSGAKKANNKQKKQPQKEATKKEVVLC